MTKSEYQELVEFIAGRFDRNYKPCAGTAPGRALEPGEHWLLEPTRVPAGERRCRGVGGEEGRSEVGACGRVEVIKGGWGRWRASVWSTERTVQGNEVLSAAAHFAASSWSR